MHPFLIKKKDLCQLVGIDQVIKGNKLSSIKRRVEFGMYPRYEIITSQNMRGSFAINDFKKNRNPILMEFHSILERIAF